MITLDVSPSFTKKKKKKKKKNERYAFCFVCFSRVERNFAWAKLPYLKFFSCRKNSI